MKTVIACLAATSCFALFALAHDHKGGDERVEELMERTHEGRRSPYGQLRRIVEGADAQWSVVEQAVRGFEPMCRALQESTNDEIKGSADGYVDAVRDIVAAVRARDPAGVRKGFAALEQSCTDCHFEGGVGGRLERDEHDRDHEDRPGDED